MRTAGRELWGAGCRRCSGAGPVLAGVQGALRRAAAPGLRGGTDGRTDGRTERGNPSRWGPCLACPRALGAPSPPVCPSGTLRARLAEAAAPHSEDQLNHGPEMCVLQSCWLRGTGSGECLCHRGCCHRACCHKVSAPSPGMCVLLRVLLLPAGCLPCLGKPFELRIDALPRSLWRGQLRYS